MGIHLFVFSFIIAFYYRSDWLLQVPTALTSSQWRNVTQDCELKWLGLALVIFVRVFLSQQLGANLRRIQMAVREFEESWQRKVTGEQTIVFFHLPQLPLVLMNGMEEGITSLTCPARFRGTRSIFFMFYFLSSCGKQKNRDSSRIYQATVSLYYHINQGHK